MILLWISRLLGGTGGAFGRCESKFIQKSNNSRNVSMNASNEALWLLFAVVVSSNDRKSCRAIFKVNFSC